jgi:phenylacetate-CoA ligase
MSHDDRLRELLGLVLEHNPFQQSRLGGLDLGPDSPLEALPTTSKAELVADQARNPPFGTNLTYPLESYTHVHQTSGTTGPPLRVLDTAEDWAWWGDCLAHSFRAAGLEASDRAALAFSFGPHVHFWAVREGLERVGAMGIPMGGMTSVQRLQTIAQMEATALLCTPTYALRLMEVAVEERLESTLESIRLVVCTGEPGASLPAVRTRIEEDFGARCMDHAGLTEVGNFGYPSRDGGGLLVDESEFICEVLGPDLQPVPPGESGELVLTALRRTGFPVIRYRTGDVVENSIARPPGGGSDRWLPGGILGRTDDMVVIRGMNVFPSAIDEAVRRMEGSGEFRVTFYSERGGMDEIKLEVELERGSDARTLQELMRQQLGLRVRVVPVAPGMLPRAEGKARRVVDERRKTWAAR